LRELFEAVREVLAALRTLFAPLRETFRACCGIFSFQNIKLILKLKVRLAVNGESGQQLYYYRHSQSHFLFFLNFVYGHTLFLPRVSYTFKPFFMRRSFFFISAISVLAISIIIFLGTGCQREVEGTGGNNNGGGGVNDDVTVVAGVRGTVIDENNQPVQGASVTSGSNTTSTDRYGVFHFNNISLSKTNGYVKVTKQGYFTGSRTFVSTAGRIHSVRIRLLPKTNAGNFAATAGGTVTLSSGGKLVMPANAVTDASGNAYTGTVNIAMTWIDPSAANLPEILVGDLRGITTAGDERGLETFGMLGVEMTGPGGQVLKIASGKTAELTFPIPASITANAPATIDMWHFDETKGRWIQEGTATKTGNSYLATVSHFSFWNCDAQFPLIDLCMTVVNAANNQPLINVQVRIKRANGSYGAGWTDSLGNLCGKVPKDEPLVLQVMDQCNNVAYSQNIGPFSSNTNLGTISATIPGANSLIITGTLVNCSGANVTNGAVAIQTTGSYNYPIAVSNGTFSITILRCSNAPISFTVIGADYATSQYSLPVSGSGSSGTVNIGNVQACGAATEFMEFIADGTPFSYIEFPPDEVNAYDSVATGPYSTRTMVLGSDVNNGNVESSRFTFDNNTAPGIYPLSTAPFAVKITNGTSLLLTQFVSANPMVTITIFGPPGGYIEGNWTEQMKQGTTGPAINVICHFKVKR
jgi:hypothetical protein